MMRYLELGGAFVLGTAIIFVLSLFHAAAVEVSRKPRLAIVTNNTRDSVLERPEDHDLTAAA